MYCKGCRERMVVDETWTEAHAKRQSDLAAVEAERKSLAWDRLSEEKKSARRARKNAVSKIRYRNLKLDPVKWNTFCQQQAERDRKRYRELKAERERKRAHTDVDSRGEDDDKGSVSVPRDVERAIPGNHVDAIGVEEAAAADSSGSDVEGIEFVYSDEDSRL